MYQGGEKALQAICGEFDSHRLHQTMKNYNQLSRAISFAVEAHAFQFDKAGMPYILHPLRVSEAVEFEEAKIVAVLHDVVEDTTVSIEEIHAVFGETIRDAVNAMTKRKGETYLHYMDRVNANLIAKRVKLADMADNSRPERIAYLSVQKQVRLAAKYARGRHYLLTGQWYESEALDTVIKNGYRK